MPVQCNFTFYEINAGGGGVRWFQGDFTFVVGAMSLRNESRNHMCVIAYKGCPDDFRKSQYKKTDWVATFFIFSFCQYGLQRSSLTSGSALITAGAPRWSSPLCHFSSPISVLIELRQDVFRGIHEFWSSLIKPLPSYTSSKIRKSYTPSAARIRVKLFLALESDFTKSL